MLGRISDFGIEKQMSPRKEILSNIETLEPGFAFLFENEKHDHLFKNLRNYVGMYNQKSGKKLSVKRIAGGYLVMRPKN